MSVKLTDKTTPGDIYVDRYGGVCRLLHYFTGPTATIENVVTGSKANGGIGCLLLDEYIPIDDIPCDKLPEIINKLVNATLSMREENRDLREQLLDVREKLIDMRMAEVEKSGVLR